MMNKIKVKKNFFNLVMKNGIYIYIYPIFSIFYFENFYYINKHSINLIGILIKKKKLKNLLIEIE
ncbi:hypothetical protein [Blattabacterium cuenoti]|uniref:hypothetical protein n=1 Tax=Blattabacterium cuenoti TaxID=1653831 RepID=UPI00163BE3B9|nr:hypothetical protein [Blattabacterium cuenoti]